MRSIFRAAAVGAAGVSSGGTSNDNNNNANSDDNNTNGTTSSSTNDTGVVSSDDSLLLQDILANFALGAYLEHQQTTSNNDNHNNENNNNNKHGPCPASGRAVRQLPLVTVTPADLVDPANRACSVCLDAVRLKDKVVRLPCAHVFHPSCIRPWLLQHGCGCPVCRYELPTDDAAYEVHRLQRMRHRKPRFARHELERMSVRQLKRLLLQQQQQEQEQHGQQQQGEQRRQQRQGLAFFASAVDKSDLIAYLMESGAIDLVETPDPVQYRLSALREMSVGQLRRVMNDRAGVFFDPATDVIEKNDMIRIFLNSGRLCLLPEEEEETVISVSESTSDADQGGGGGAEEEKKEEEEVHEYHLVVRDEDGGIGDINDAIYPEKPSLPAVLVSRNNNNREESSSLSSSSSAFGGAFGGAPVVHPKIVRQQQKPPANATIPTDKKKNGLCNNDDDVENDVERVLSSWSEDFLSYFLPQCCQCA